MPVPRRAKWFLLLALTVWSMPGVAQDDSAQAPTDDLSAAAHKAKADREQQQRSGSTTSEAIKQMADEIAEGPDGMIGPVPVGYRVFVSEGRDYALFVPQFAEIEGRDPWLGLKLLASSSLDTRTEVILGPSIPVKGDTPKEMLQAAVDRYFGGCDLARWIRVDDLNGRPRTTVNFQNCWTNQVNGSAQFVLGDGYAIPVICGYPYTPQDLSGFDQRTLYDPKARKAAIDRDNTQRNGIRACEVILPSFHFLPHGVAAKLKSVSGGPKQPAITNALASNGQASGEQPPSEGGQAAPLGTIARAQKKPRKTAVVEDLKHLPSGFNNLDFRYCNKQDCYDASMLLPANAERNPNYGNYPIGLFQYIASIKTARVTVEAVTAGPSESEIANPEQVLASHYHIEDYSSAAQQKQGQLEILGDQKTTIGGLPARWTTVRTHNAVETLLTQQVEYMAPGMFVVIRCMTAEKFAADAHDVCTTVIQSLTIPQPKDEAGDPPPGGDDSQEQNNE
jgi:hypothetical protein